MAKRPAPTEGGVGKVMEMLTEHSVEYVDLRFTDPRGKWQHTAQHVSTVKEDVFTEGFMFDGSSIAGWKAINESDMILMPDPATAVMDPFAAKASMILICDIVEPSTGQSYSRDPRGTAKRLEAFVKASGVGDTVLVGAEAEFFVFDSVKYRYWRQLRHVPDRQHGGPAGFLEGLPRGEHGAPSHCQGRLFPGAAGRQRERSACRDAVDDGRDGSADREASP